jgi:hypothetical protein
VVRFNGLLLKSELPLACTYLSSKVVFIFLIGFSLRFTNPKTMSPIGHGLMRIRCVI